MNEAEITVATNVAWHIGERWSLFASNLSVLLAAPIDQIERWNQALGTRGARDRAVAPLALPDDRQSATPAPTARGSK